MIPFLDLTAQHKALSSELMPVVLEVIESGNFVLGEHVHQFEQEFAKFCGAREAVALNTGTSALHLALLAAGVGPGDEVITVSMTFVATAAAILYCGAKPVFVDIDPRTWTMSPDALVDAITPRTKAVVPVHLHGRLADMGSISAVARKHGLLLIEDAAQAHGAERDGKRAGTFGEAGCFSFYPGKNLGACGEAGALVTDNPELAQRIRLLRDWGQAGKYNHVERGFNYRMDALQAAILRVKLRYLPAWTERRRRAAYLYDAMLKDARVLCPTAGDVDHVYHVYAINVAQRDHMRSRLEERKISTGIHYPRPVHLQPAYADLCQQPHSLPVTENFAAHTLSLPIFPEITAEQIQRVSEAVAEISEETHAQAA